MKRFLIGLAILTLFALFLWAMIAAFGGVPAFSQSPISPPITDPSFACILECVESGKDPVECEALCDEQRPFPPNEAADLELKGYFPIIRKDKPPPPRPTPNI